MIPYRWVIFERPLSFLHLRSFVSAPHSTSVMGKIRPPNSRNMGPTRTIDDCPWCGHTVTKLRRFSSVGTLLTVCHECKCNNRTNTYLCYLNACLERMSAQTLRSCLETMRHKGYEQLPKALFFFGRHIIGTRC